MEVDSGERKNDSKANSKSSSTSKLSQYKKHFRG